MKAIRDTELGKAVLEDVVQMAEIGNRYYGEEWRQMKMVMILDELRRETGREVYGREIKSEFNSLKRDIMYTVLRQHQEARECVDYFLRPGHSTSRRMGVRSATLR